MPYNVFGPMERTPVLQIGDPLDCHLSLSIHGQICLAVYGALFHRIGGILRVARVSGNHGLGLHLFDNVGENLLGIEIGITSYDFNGDLGAAVLEETALPSFHLYGLVRSSQRWAALSPDH